MIFLQRQKCPMFCGCSQKPRERDTLRALVMQVALLVRTIHHTADYPRICSAALKGMPYFTLPYPCIVCCCVCVQILPKMHTKHRAHTCCEICKINFKPNTGQIGIREVGFRMEWEGCRGKSGMMCCDFLFVCDGGIDGRRGVSVYVVLLTLSLVTAL